MGSSPHLATARWLGSLGMIAVVLTACGSAQGSPSVTAEAKVSPTPTAVGATPTLPVIPPPPPIPPLFGFSSSPSGQPSLYSVTGTRTFTFPANSPYQVISPLGSRLLVEHQDSSDAVDALLAMTATGTTTTLETITHPADFIDAIGSEDGTRWAWMLKGPVNGCAGNPPPPTDTDVYISSTPGQGTLIAKLPPLKPAGVGWTFYQWTDAGIVLDEGGRPGCYEGPRINVDATDLLNPSTGSVTSLAPKLGTGECILQDISDDGTMACIPKSSLIDDLTTSPSTTALRIVFPNAMQRNVTAGPFLQGCSTASPVQFGDVTLSSDANLVSLTRWCSPPHDQSTILIDTWTIDTETLDIAKVSVGGLDATAWLPGTSTLIATGNAQDYGVGSYSAGTFTVAADGTATELTSDDVGWQCLDHF